MRKFYFLTEIINHSQQNIFDNEKTIRLFCDSRLNVSVIKRVLFFLEKQKMVEITRSIKNSNIDVALKETMDFNKLIEMGILDEDLNRCLSVRKLIPRIRN